MNNGFNLGGRLITALVLAALTTVTAAAGSNSPKKGSLGDWYGITWESFSKKHPPHKHCQKNNENGEGFVRCFLDQKKVEGTSGWKADFLFFKGALIELQLTRPTDEPATYDTLKAKLSKSLWQPVASEINDPTLNVRDAKILRGTETTSWTYRDTTWKQEQANKKHREIRLTESIEFPTNGAKPSKKPTSVSILIKNHN
ncbi:MAG TPA: hypothetical protein V6D19_13720 [Stenomitos sp.]